jgi:hypothetical protein
MNILIGIRRLDHIQYFSSVLNNLISNSSKVYFAIDPDFLLNRSVSETKSYLSQNFDWDVHELFTLSENTESSIKSKRLLGCLVYLNDTNLEWDYLVRHAKRSRIRSSSFLLLFTLKLLPSKIRVFFSSRLTRKLRKNLRPSNLINGWLEELDLDLIFISPGNMYESKEDNLVVDGSYLKVPTVVQTLSWDNLNSKGTVMAIPDLYLAWNEMHATLLQTRHLVPSENIGMPGSLFLEKYSESVRSFGREELCEALGIPSDKKLIIYMGSSLNVCVDESLFLKALLERFPNFASDYFLLIRPHPANTKVWLNWSVAGTYVWPKFQSLDSRATNETFCILNSSIGTVGINTSGFLDSLACGVPIVAIANPDAIFQEQTGHFSRLVSDGLQVTTSLQEAIKLLESKEYRESLLSTLEITLPNRSLATTKTLELLENLQYQSKKGSI